MTPTRCIVYGFRFDRLCCHSGQCTCSPSLDYKLSRYSTLAKMAAKQKRVSLTIKRKIELIQKLESGCKKRKEIAEEYGISAGCVTKIMSEKETLKSLYYSGKIDPKIQRPHRVAR